MVFKKPSNQHDASRNQEQTRTIASVTKNHPHTIIESPGIVVGMHGRSCDCCVSFHFPIVGQGRILNRLSNTDVPHEGLVRNLQGAGGRL